MTLATARRSRIVIDEGPDILRIVIPALRPGSGIFLAFFGLWLSFANLAAIIAALGMVPVEGGYDPGEFAAMTLLFNVIGLPVFLWHLIGREVVRLDDRTLSIRLELCGLAWTRTFDPARIGGLHVIPDSLRHAGKPGGPAFLDGDRLRTFGSRVLEA